MLRETRNLELTCVPTIMGPRLGWVTGAMHLGGMVKICQASEAPTLKQSWEIFSFSPPSQIPSPLL